MTALIKVGHDSDIDGRYTVFLDPSSLDYWTYDDITGSLCPCSFNGHGSAKAPDTAPERENQFR